MYVRAFSSKQREWVGSKVLRVLWDFLWRNLGESIPLKRLWYIATSFDIRIYISILKGPFGLQILFHGYDEY